MQKSLVKWREDTDGGSMSRALMKRHSTVEQEVRVCHCMCYIHATFDLFLIYTHAVSHVYVHVNDVQLCILTLYILGLNTKCLV